MPRTSPTQADVASSYTLWCEYFDTLGIDSREDFDAMLNSKKMEMLAFAFGADVDADVDMESAPRMTPERAAEAAAATIRAVTRWRAALAGRTHADPNEALNAGWEAGEAYESLPNEAH